MLSDFRIARPAVRVGLPEIDSGAVMARSPNGATKQSTRGRGRGGGMDGFVAALLAMTAQAKWKRLLERQIEKLASKYPGARIDDVILHRLASAVGVLSGNALDDLEMLVDHTIDLAT